MDLENWTPLTTQEIEKKFIGMINDYLKLNLEYPVDPNLSLKDLRLVGDTKVIEQLQDVDEESLEIIKKNFEIDSIDILELVIQIEEEFGVVIDDKDVATLLRWEDLIGYIADSQDPKKMKQK
jgi:acyl carrier protein